MFFEYNSDYMKKIFICLLLLTLCLGATNSSYAEEEKEKKTGPLSGMEFLTGFAYAKLHFKGTYDLIPIMVDFNFDFKPILSKININLKQPVEFQIEPFFSVVYKPDNNIETGTTFLFKIGLLPEGSKIQPYLKAGAGVMYMTQHTREQGMQFNFIEQGGVGINYFFTKNTALTLEGRIRHLSNSGLATPNHGINTYFVITGITYKY